MKIENPYKEDIAEDGWEMPSGEQSEHNAWGEGYHSRDEEVSDLVEVLEVVALQMKVWSSGWPISDLMQWIDEARANVNVVIAKAKP